MANATELSDKQKRSFYRDGFIVLKDAVSKELIHRAKRRINIIAGREGHLFKYYGELSSSPEFPDLVNRSSLGKILRNTMGPYDPPVRAMPMVLYPHAVEAFFRMQRDAGGPIGPEGPGWPRLEPRGDDGVAINYLPQAIRDQFSEGAEFTPDGTMWPRPTPILLDEGDAVITVHAIPHCGTRNETGAEPRMNVYFRLRRHRPGGARVNGDSDHPDRGWKGDFLDYPQGYDPWQVAIDALCDQWSEWDGMAGVVAAERSRGTAQPA